jgi:hypothetical protein
LCNAGQSGELVQQTRKNAVYASAQGVYRNDQGSIICDFFFVCWGVFLLTFTLYSQANTGNPAEAMRWFQLLAQRGFEATALVKAVLAEATLTGSVTLAEKTERAEKLLATLQALKTDPLPCFPAIIYSHARFPARAEFWHRQVGYMISF